MTAELPGAAEWARTLAAGVVPGTVQLPPVGDGPPNPRECTFRVQHLADVEGRIGLLVGDDTPLHHHLGGPLGSLDDVPTVLDVLDVPPGQFRLPRARLCVTGWVQPLARVEQREFAAALAAGRPVGALLGVGNGATLYRLDVTEVCVTTGGEVSIVDEAAFAAAQPDPLYEAEDDIAGHLTQFHRDRMVAYALRHLPKPVGAALRDVSVAGLDRYGLDLQCATLHGYRALRASFGTPAEDPDGFAARLCEVFGCPCETAVAGGRAGATRSAG